MKGFTLIELLISLVFISMLVGTCGVLSITYLVEDTPQEKCLGVCDARKKSVYKENPLICKCEYRNKTIYYQIDGDSINEVQPESK